MNASQKKDEVKEGLLNSKVEASDAPKAKAKAADSTWGDSGDKHYGLWYFVKFTFPFMWKGGPGIKIQTVLTFLCLILSKCFNVAHPAILGMVVDSLVCAGKGLDNCPTKMETYQLVGAYALLKFLADFVRYIVEIPFSNVSASAEVYIASMVYKHIQNQSLSFHLNRETGKIVRLTSRGS
jgi:ABC-type multidrug transport system fused ATPase/permease subunit